MSKIKGKNAIESKFLDCDHLDKIGEIATYYGFVPAKSPQITKEDLHAAKSVLEGDFVEDENDAKVKMPLRVEEKIATLRNYAESNMHTWPQPVMLYFKDPCRACAHVTLPKRGGYSRYADLEILGSSGPIAEATLIQTATAMLREEGYESIAVEINSIGDRESINRFVRELTAYYRKHINDMSAACRQLFKKDPFELLSFHDPSCKELNEHAPRSMDFLTEDSRRHLEEVLEYLETLKIPYTINNSLLGNRKYCAETIFSIVDSSVNGKAKEQHILALGFRYNGLAKKISAKRDIQGVGISLLIKENGNGLRKPVAKVKRPIASFIQLGMESKLRSLEVIENLRKVKIPLQLCLAKDRLGAQVSSVEKFRTPYVIVMGKKEAVEGTVIVRENETHSQDIVPIPELPKYMKRIEDKYFKK